MILKKINKKLNDPQTNAKIYWFILKIFFDGRKIPVLLPLLIGGKLVSDFKEKLNTFNEFFSRQCAPLNLFLLLRLTSVVFYESHMVTWS